MRVYEKPPMFLASFLRFMAFRELLLLTQEGLRPQAEGWRERTEEAESWFLQALEIARQQEAKSLELRAVMSLVRLRQKQALEQGAESKERNRWKARKRGGEEARSASRPPSLPAVKPQTEGAGNAH
jgi:hypothetical protein